MAAVASGSPYNYNIPYSEKTRGFVLAAGMVEDTKGGWIHSGRYAARFSEGSALGKAVALLATVPLEDIPLLIATFDSRTFIKVLRGCPGALGICSCCRD